MRGDGNRTLQRVGAIPSLERALSDSLNNASRRIVADLIISKLTGLGIKPTQTSVDQLERFVNGEDAEETLAWIDDLAPDFDFSPEDWDQVNKSVEELLAAAPKIITTALKEGATQVLSTARSDWRRRRHDHIAAEIAFEAQLQGRWGTAFDELRFLRVICSEMRDEALLRWRRSRAKRGRLVAEVLLHLHARACQVASEVQALVEGGYADGAMARWRTLYEITVIASLLSDGGDELASRYLDHEHIDAKRASDQYKKHHVGLGQTPLSESEVRSIELNYASTLLRYGAEFATNYGWASAYLSLKNPRFGDLQDAAGSASMGPYYKMASYPVHADVKGLTWRLSALGRSGVLIAGASNAGLDEPGLNTAISLTAVTALLVRSTKADDVVFLSSIAGQRDKVVTSFLNAGRKLKRDHNKARRAALRSRHSTPLA